MNFLQLCQRVRQEASIAGTGPSAVTGQVGEMKRVVDWVADAWLQIQRQQQHWLFLRQDFSFGLVASVGEYTPDGASGVGASLTDFRMWHPETLRAYRTDLGVVDEMPVVEWPYQEFRNVYRYALQVQGRPVVFTQRPRDMALMFGPVPEQAYTVRGEYQRTPQTLSVDTDTPIMPTHHHMAIVWHALLSYGEEQSAPEVIMRASRNLAAAMTDLQNEQLPRVGFARPLA